ncbi:MAG: glycoside hydrolase family 9 protein [Hallerella porci]|uniref:Endoglucanase n=1 Tax=Hallerella porci TaxID=1945871 RepID=A0ABX5LLG3_9BACT|nr:MULTISPECIES: glycoside hydrolase family 9 protein [Hallerella]MCI5600540.1 glycoside hydrolase family 9 protein [Hallerella sp.]MDY3922145.1 glycoside hydrolase family 9 protein [Hallerella porci]PWL03280.1 non-processive endocellulase [Hallerella porci]
MNFLKFAFFCFAASVFAGPLLINQLGFNPESEKFALVPGSDANDAEIRDMDGKTILKIKAPLVYDWNYSGEEVQTYDFSSIKTPGVYRLYRGGEYLGNPIIIDNHAYENLTKAALKWFYFQRVSAPVDYQYGGKWMRASGHPDDKVIVYGTDESTKKGYEEATGKKAPKELKVISSPKGWYDAGDYGKYIVNSGITVFTLLELYENFSSYMDTLSWNIPREYKNYPAILEEVRYNLDWMLSVQDNDGGVYHKVTTLAFGGPVMPEKDGAPRYAILKSLTATLDFAATMAQASVVYKKFDKAYAEKCLKASELAYAWAKKNPKALYKQPSDVETGNYTHSGEDAKDEFRWASAELYRATKKANYLKELKENPFTNNGAWWGDVNMLAVFRVALDEAFPKDVKDAAKKVMMNEANNLRAVGDSSGYHLPAFDWSWNWGSNSAMANNAMVLLHAYLLTKDKSYVDGAQQVLDYLIGKNPMEISYVTGFGFRSPRKPHHRPSQCDLVDDPVPGMLVGGPHLGKQDINLDGKDAWKCPNYASSEKPALAYLDDECSYATNEVAINWNAPLAYVAGALQAIYQGISPSVKK